MLKMLLIQLQKIFFRCTMTFFTKYTDFQLNYDLFKMKDR